MADNPANSPGYGYDQDPQMQPIPQLQPMQMQSAPVQNTVVVVNQQPQSKIYPQNVRDWSTGLCDCCSDLETCCCGFFCLPCLLGMTLSKMHENCCVCCMGNAGVWAMRSKLRGMMGISGGLCSDCCVAVCCTQLAVCQIHRELKNIGLL